MLPDGTAAAAGAERVGSVQGLPAAFQAAQAPYDTTSTDDVPKTAAIILQGRVFGAQAEPQACFLFLPLKIT